MKMLLKNHFLMVFYFKNCDEIAGDPVRDLCYHLARNIGVSSIEFRGVRCFSNLIFIAFSGKKLNTTFVSAQFFGANLTKGLILGNAHLKLSFLHNVKREKVGSPLQFEFN